MGIETDFSNAVKDSGSHNAWNPIWMSQLYGKFDFCHLLTEGSWLAGTHLLTVQNHSLSNALLKIQEPQ